MALRSPLDKKDLPAAMAVRSLTGVSRGIDYRGTAVLAAFRRVGKSHWHLITKMDLDEIYAPVKKQGLLIVGLAGLLIFAVGTMLRFYWKQQRSESRAKEYEAELERLALTSHYDHLTQYANDIILLMNKDLRIIEANDSAVSAYGYKREELLEISLESLQPDQFRDSLAARMQELEATRSLIYETVQLRKDGTTFPAEVSSRLIEIEGRKFYQDIVRDITVRKRMEETLERVRHENELILQSAGDGIFGVDLDGNFTFINPAGARALGYTVEELLSGKSSHTLCHHSRTDGTSYPREACPIYSVCQDGVQRHITDEVFWTKDNQPFPVQYTSTPVRENGRIVGAVVTFTDITERKRIEEELRRNEARQRALLKLYQMENASRLELAAFINEECVKLSGSKLGFVGFLDEEQKVMTTQVWCDEAMKECRVQGSPCGFNIETAGLWAESARQKRPIIVTDYLKPNPLKKGCPPGHVQLTRFLSIPAFWPFPVWGAVI